MATYDSIVVGEDWISEHYFGTDSVKESFQGKVVELRKAWDEEHREARTTVRSQFLSALGDLQKALVRLNEDPGEVAAANTLTRRALQWPEQLTDFTGERAGTVLTIPGAVPPGTTGVLLIQATAVGAIEDLFDPTVGRLIEAGNEDGHPIEAAVSAVSAAFRCDQPPGFVLVQAGQWILLAEAARWAEGRYLAVDLLVVADRRHDARGGEIDRAVAILGRPSLAPEADGNVWWTGVLEDSVRHTVGVSKDLREGIRLSIEIIANEVVRRRRDRDLTMDGIDGNDLARQSLRFLYRILFLLYAEASPELQVLPTKVPEYAEGYGLDRLRDLTLTELVSPAARHGTHLYESLATLFRLVDRGHRPPGTTDNADDPAPGLEFNSLRADLFAPPATSLIDDVRLGNASVQRVLEHLLLSKQSRGRKGADRGFISYAELGINQLGAVYEGLMSYTGFFAEEDLYEVAKGGDPSKGSWVVPVDSSDHLESSDFVRVLEEATGELVPVRHEKGTFVFRLAGRERQQSASYYTPEVLTRFVVSQSLAELLDQDGVRTTPEQILKFTICEPALGSGAFAIEAVRQLAAEYLKRKQEDLGRVIDADQYQVELQKVKAHIALHQVYGVDLNATAVELAEISLWLDTMVAGLAAPWFGLHLRRGNSLIGGRRAVYKPSQLAKKEWLKTVPRDVPLGESIGDGIHHFLLPAEGWGAVVDTAEAKTYAPDEREQLRLWRNSIRASPSAAIKKRLAALASRVETLWSFTLRRLEIAEAEISRTVDLWGSEQVSAAPAVSREQIEKVLHDENGAYRRLRRVMDAWCALWFWPLNTDIEPPDWDTWAGGLEALLGVSARVTAGERRGQLSAFGDFSWAELDDAESNDLVLAQAAAADVVKTGYPWLTVAEAISNVQGFLHWEVDFAQVFHRGGFNLQVGNPPWVRPDWDEAAILAEFDPWWQLTDRPSETIKRYKRAETLVDSGTLASFLDFRTEQAGNNAHLASGVDRPRMSGLQPDLYRCFMDKAWQSMASRGIVGLIHPESHFNEQRAAALRIESYRRLRRHWQFRNELRLFEVHNAKEYGIHIYGSVRNPDFLHGATIFHPDTVRRSLQHDGTGTAPGVKDDLGRWDTRPHAERIISVDSSVLSTWSSLVGEPGTTPTESPLLYPVNKVSADVLEKIGGSSRVADAGLQWTAGWHETADRQKAYFVSRSATPLSWDDVILQGPHLGIANPLGQQPNSTMRSNKDYLAVQLDTIPQDFVPRTNYQVAVPYADYIAGYPKWGEMASSSFYRLAWRRMTNSANVRGIHAAIIPPGPCHIHGVISARMNTELELARAAGFWSSIPVDFLVKVSGVGELNQGVVRRLPHVKEHFLDAHLVLRTLRLNALIERYSSLWTRLFNPEWRSDSWSVESARIPNMGNVDEKWSWGTPIRPALARRQALIEIDAIVSIMLGITVDELLIIYRTQFPVLQKYEREALYDANGRQLPTRLASEYRKRGRLRSEDLTVDGITYVEPFEGVDRERDMELAHKHFSALLAEKTAAATKQPADGGR